MHSYMRDKYPEIWALYERDGELERLYNGDVLFSDVRITPCVDLISITPNEYVNGFDALYSGDAATVGDNIVNESVWEWLS